MTSAEERTAERAMAGSLALPEIFEAPAFWARYAPQAAWAFVALGILLRLARYLLCFPLWGDECMVAVNFLDRPMRPLAAGAGASQALVALGRAGPSHQLRLVSRGVRRRRREPRVAARRVGAARGAHVVCMGGLQPGAPDRLLPDVCDIWEG